MMKCHEVEKAESIRLHCFLPGLASFLNLEVVRKKRAVFVQTEARQNSHQNNEQTKEQPGFQQTRRERLEWLSRELVEVKLKMMDGQRWG